MKVRHNYYNIALFIESFVSKNCFIEKRTNSKEEILGGSMRGVKCLLQRSLITAH